MGYFEYFTGLLIMIEFLALFTIAFRIQHKAGWDNLGIIFIAGVSAYAFSIVGWIGILFGVFVGFIIGVVGYKVEKFYFTLFTLSLLLISMRIVSIDFLIPFTNGQAGKFIFGGSVLIYLTGTLIIFLILNYFIEKKYGLLLRAVSENETRFVLLGKNPGFYKMLTWIFTGVVASIGGVFLALHLSYISPGTFSWWWVNSILAAGLFGNLIIGSVAIILIPEAARVINVFGNGAAIQQIVIALMVLVIFWRDRFVRNKKNVKSL